MDARPQTLGGGLLNLGLNLLAVPRYGIVGKALAADGPSFLNVLVPCPLGWGHPGNLTIEMSKLAADTCFWPIYECENGKYKINYEPKEKKPIEEFMKPQGRFSHLFKDEKGKAVIAEAQRQIDAQWALLHKRQEAFGMS